MTRIILAIDRQDWSFHNVARQICSHLQDTHRFIIADAAQVKGECDILVVFWWGSVPEVQKRVKYKKLVVPIYDHLSWNRSEGDRDSIRWCIDQADVVAVPNAQLVDELTGSPIKAQTPVVIVEDGVDTTLFQDTPPPEAFKVGWCGNSAVGYGKVKGLDHIVEACHHANAELAVMDFANCGGLSHFMMPSWYRGISVYLNGSSAEGTPNPPLEAMASGRPVISTKCGVMPRLIEHGYNGYLVDRDPWSMAAAVDQVRRRDLEVMGKAARQTALRWDWPQKVQAWRTVFAATEHGRPKSPAVVKTRPRGLLVADVRGWAFDINEQDMAEYCKDEFDFDHYYLADKQPPPYMGKYRFSFLPYHRWLIDHYWWGAPYLGSLRSQWFDPAKPEVISPQDEAFVRRSHGFHVCYGAAYQGMRGRFPQVVYLTNPVNMRKFQRQTEVTGKIVCEWNGNPEHGQEPGQDIKGIHGIIKPVCESMGQELVTQEFGVRLPHDQMSDFYCKANVALCASKYEGASNSVMEAMASGLAVIATDVGNHAEMQASQLDNLGDTGIILADRSKEGFRSALEQLTPERAKQMGEINREEITKRWSWDAWADSYREFFRMAL